MLTDTEELEVAWKALAAEDKEPGWLTVALGRSGPRFRAGMQVPAGTEALLVGFNTDAMPRSEDLPVGSGFKVEISDEQFVSGFSRWICLSCQNAAGRELFVQMAADLVAALSTEAERGEGWLLYLMLARIRAWQEFMRRPRTGILSSEEETGLFGELVFLRELLKRGGPSVAIVQMWQGPAGGLQDFQGLATAVEIKSTLSVNGFPARISSLEQLDSATGRAVQLAAIRLSLQERGQTLTGLIAEIRALTDADPLGRQIFERSLMLTGFLDAAADHYVRKFSVVETRVFEIGSSFPCLARSRTPVEIRAATYDIDIDLIREKSLALDEAIVRFGVR